MTRFLLKTLASLCMPVYVYKNTSQDVKMRLTLAYTGHSIVKRNNLSQFLYGDTCPEAVRKGFVWFWTIPNKLKENKWGCDVLFSEMSLLTERILSNHKGFKIPEWIGMALETSEPMEKLKKRSPSGLADAERLIRKYHLTHEILSREEGFDEFYKNYYFPYTRKRFGPKGIITPYKALLGAGEAGFILKIKSKDGPISAALITTTDKKIKLFKWGLRTEMKNI